MDTTNVSIDETDLYSYEYERESKKAKEALLGRVTTILSHFKIDHKQISELNDLASNWHIPFDGLLCIYYTEPYMFVDLGLIPSELRMPLLWIPEIVLLEGRYVPVSMLIAALKAPLDFVFPKKRENNKQKTYVMHDPISGLCKIGKAVSPKFREKTLHAEMPKIKLIKIYESNIESALHRAFASKRIRGEWFNVTFDEIDRVASDLLKPIV